MPKETKDYIRELKKAKARADTLENVITGLGMHGRDKRVSGKVTWSPQMSETAMEEMYAGDGLPRRIVELMPQEATREWVEFDEEDPEIEDALEDLEAEDKFCDADISARLHGGACLLINTGLPRKQLAFPLDENNIKQIKSLVLLTRYELNSGMLDIDTDLSSPNYGKPLTYQLYERKGINPKPIATIHWTHLLRFDGAKLPLMAYIRNNYWHDSVLTGVMEAAKDMLTTMAGVATVMGEFRMIQYFIEGLADIIASGDEELLIKRMKMVNQARSITGMTVLDVKEKMEVHADTFAGVKDIIEVFKDNMALRTGYPKIILFQDSPGGLQSSGSSELEGWYNMVAHYQKKTYKKPFNRLLHLLFLSKKGPTKGTIPENPNWTFKKLWSESASDVAKNELAEAQADQIRLDQGVLEPSDVIKARYPDKAAEMGDAELAAMDEAIKEQAAEAKANLAKAAAQGPAPAKGDEPPAPKEKTGQPVKKADKRGKK